ncbi:MAG: PTS sugar transporter subunit IIC [Lachnospiraceae bacterium]|jgi:mannose/fructose/N-acetylgalactosamine-specific phosphotransferase system component IIC|nr:PTS sugar transporter subunit IIC [Lachnospiraceae bacterium]MCI9306445.1 PTS sugar transporter subunit IIC [Lachnospiraceae bacterium]
MSIFQALLLALFGWMSSIYSPVLMGGLGGWYTLGRPLVSGMVIGIILGDVQTGIIMGAAIQMLYIGLVTPGGAMPADVNFASWIGIPLAMVGGAGTEFALALAVPLSTLGVFAVYGLCAINLFFVHKQDAYVEKGEFDKAARIPIVGQITNIALRFFPILIINYFGADLVSKLVEIMPLWLTDILQIFANMLPLVGFMLLMRTLVKKDLDLIYFVLGFILVSVANIGMIPIVIAALVIAYLKYQTSEKEG